MIIVATVIRTTAKILWQRFLGIHLWHVLWHLNKL